MLYTRTVVLVLALMPLPMVAAATSESAPHSHVAALPKVDTLPEEVGFPVGIYYASTRMAPRTPAIMVWEDGRIIWREDWDVGELDEWGSSWAGVSTYLMAWIDPAEVANALAAVEAEGVFADSGKSEDQGRLEWEDTHVVLRTSDNLIWLKSGKEVYEGRSEREVEIYSFSLSDSGEWKQQSAPVTVEVESEGYVYSMAGLGAMVKLPPGMTREEWLAQAPEEEQRFVFSFNLIRDQLMGLRPDPGDEVEVEVIEGLKLSWDWFFAGSDQAQN